MDAETRIQFSESHPAAFVEVDQEPVRFEVVELEAAAIHFKEFACYLSRMGDSAKGFPRARRLPGLDAVIAGLWSGYRSFQSAAIADGWRAAKSGDQLGVGTDDVLNGRIDCH